MLKVSAAILLATLTTPAAAVDLVSSSASQGPYGYMKLMCDSGGLRSSLVAKDPSYGARISGVLAKVADGVSTPLDAAQDRYIPGIIVLKGFDQIEKQMFAEGQITLKVENTGSGADVVQTFNFDGLRDFGTTAANICPPF